MKINFKFLIVAFLSVILVAVLGSLFTSGNSSSDWYEAVKPSITPPGFVFPIVWNILFLMIALSFYFALINSKKKYLKKVYLIFGINFILNIFWSYLYFGIRNPFAAFIEIIFLEISILVMVIYTWKISKLSSILLWPYLVWVGFASVLNYLTLGNL